MPAKWADLMSLWNGAANPLMSPSGDRYLRPEVGLNGMTLSPTTFSGDDARQISNPGTLTATGGDVPAGWQRYYFQNPDGSVGSKQVQQSGGWASNPDNLAALMATIVSMGAASGAMGGLGAAGQAGGAGAAAGAGAGAGAGAIGSGVPSMGLMSAADLGVGSIPTLSAGEIAAAGGGGLLGAGAGAAGAGALGTGAGGSGALSGTLGSSGSSLPGMAGSGITDGTTALTPIGSGASSIGPLSAGDLGVGTTPGVTASEIASGAVGLSGGGLSGLWNSANGILGSPLGKLGSALLGGALGSQPNTQTVNGVKQVDPRIAPYIYGQGGILSNAANLYSQNPTGINDVMRQGWQKQLDALNNPSNAAAYLQMQNMGRGMLGSGIAANPFSMGQMGLMTAPGASSGSSALQYMMPAKPALGG
jgi:hypothetical protein